MKKETKAILMSALLFPGAGHFFLKRYLSASALIALSLVSLFIIAQFIFKQARLITEKILNGEVEADFLVIRELIAQEQAANGSLLIDIATYSLVVTWLIGIVDCYRLSRNTLYK